MRETAYNLINAWDVSLIETFQNKFLQTLIVTRFKKKDEQMAEILR